MHRLDFEPARREHAKAIEEMRNAASLDLTEKLGPGHWSGTCRLQSIRERIDLGDPDSHTRKTLYVASRDGGAVGSVAVATFFPTFWKKQYWMIPGSPALGVFDMAVHPVHQRQGIGRFLMEGVERLAAGQGFAFVRLDAFRLNPFSNAFYRSAGYEERAVIDLRGCGLVLYEKRIYC